MAKADTTRLREGALSAEKTPTKPPAEPRLVPLKRAAQSNNNGKPK